LKKIGIAPLGPNVNGFEEDLQQYLGNDKHIGVLSSGTAAIHLALVQLGVSHGDEVICQSLLFADPQILLCIKGQRLFL